MEDQRPPDEDEGEELEAWMEEDRPAGMDSWGTTAEEQLEGEPLDRRLAEEDRSGSRPDEPLELVDEGDPDEEAELVGDAVPEEGPFPAPAEEAAMHVRERAPGATDHEDVHDNEDEEDEEG